MSPGGAQKFFNITPDLSCFGKGIANGFPVSALVGKEEYMKKANDLFYSLTFAGETVSLAAASAALKEYKSTNLSKSLEKKGNYLIKLISKIFKEQSLEYIFRIEGMPCRPIISIIDSNLNYKKKELINFEIIKTLSKMNILYNGSIFIAKTHSYDDLKYFAYCFARTISIIKILFKL
jgi:glutamate-1-semialdehyde 2,1-aminomutase